MRSSPYKQFQRLLPWIPLILVSLFYIFELIPGKGVSLIDESWMLYSAWAMATPGIPLDTHNVHVTGFFINGILMFLGFESYYSLRIMFHVFILISFFVFFTGVYSGKDDIPKILPLLAPIALFGPAHILISHANGPVLFLICALGTYYHYLNAENNRKKMALLVISAVCLGMSGFANITVFPASLLACILLSIKNKEKSHSRIYFLIYFLTFAGLLSWYIQSVGIDDFSRGTVDHSLSAAVQKIPLVFMFDIHWLVTFAVLFLLGALAKKGNIINEFNRLNFGLALLFVTVSFYALLFTDMSIYGLNIVDALDIHWIKNFDLDWFMDSWDLHIQHWRGSLSFALIWLALLSCYRGKEIHKRFLLFSFLAFVYFSGHAAASRVRPQLTAGWYSGPFLAVSILLFYDCLKDSNLLKKSIQWKLFSVSLGMIFFFGMIYQTNYSFFARPYWVHKEPVNVAKLYGLREIPLKKAALEKMARIYEDQGCAEKEFIAMVNSPLFYYLFERKATGKGSWINQNRDFYPQINKIFLAIKSERGSCVYLSREFDMPEKWKDFEGAQRMKSFLDTRSDIKIHIGPYIDPTGIFWVYVFHPNKDAK